MPEGLLAEDITETAPPPRLLVELPCRRRVFAENLGDIFFRREPPPLSLRSAPAPFWPDVFVKRGLPWFCFLESGAYHVILFALLIALSRLLAMRPQAAPVATFEHSQVIYYQPSEYLPPLDTRSAPPAPSP